MRQTATARARRGRWRWRWPVVGLLLTVAFLAHDVVMTGDAHAGGVTGSHAQEARGHHSSAITLPDHAGVPAADDEVHCPSTDCAPPTDCRVGQRLTLTRANDGGHLDPCGLIGPAVPSLEHPPALPAVRAGSNPTLPPGVRRALLQVFLI